MALTDCLGEDKANATITNFNGGHLKKKDLLFVTKLKDRGLSVIDIAAVIETIELVCPVCFDSEEPCHCWNDE
jgi:hypothetical protein